ncbi:hypothetical protein [Taibaiella koreensis]|uniref:hypothetical protein n=1 Tax=Taibaiella koreensis TaxID=1268548 RepID=UPI000E59E0B4|nr:hypothetical protein [Taibaiella koreensis]
MKKTGSIALAAAAATTLCLLGSCKKDKEENLIIGQWQVQYTGADDNSNGILEESEKVMIPDTARFTFNFKEGGAGETILVPSLNSRTAITVPFTWSKNASTVTVTANNETNVVTLLTLDRSVFYGVYGEGKDRTWLYAVR